MMKSKNSERVLLGSTGLWSDPAGWLKDYGTHLRMFSCNARLFLLGSFFIGLGFSIFQLLLNLYFKELHFSEGVIGNILSMAALGSVLIATPAAIVLTRYPAKAILICSTLLSGVAYLLQATVVQRAGLLTASFTTGMMVAVVRVATAPFFMQNSKPAERTYLFSINFGIGTLAGFVGSLLGGWLPGLFGRLGSTPILAHRYALFVAAFFTMLAALPLAWLRETAREPRSFNPQMRWAVVRKKSALYFKLCFPFFILGLGAGLVIPFLNLYFKLRFHQSASQIGIFFAALQFAMLLGVLVGPILVRKWGMINTIVYSQLISIPFMLILAFTYSLPLAVVAFLLRGSLMNLGQPISVNFAMEMVTIEDHALTNSLMMLSWMGAWTLSTKLGGKLIASYSFTLPLLITVGFYIVSSVLYLWFFAGTTVYGQAAPAPTDPRPEAG